MFFDLAYSCGGVICDVGTWSGGWVGAACVWLAGWLAALAGCAGWGSEGSMPPWLVGLVLVCFSCFAFFGPSLHGRWGVKRQPSFYFRSFLQRQRLSVDDSCLRSFL